MGDNDKKTLHIPSLCAFFLSLVLLDLVFRAAFLEGGFAESCSGTALLFSLFWAAGLTGFVCLFPDRGRRIAMPLLVAFWSALCLVHSVIHHLTGSFFSVADLDYAEDGVKFFSKEYLIFSPGFMICALCVFLAVLCMSVCMEKAGYSRGRAILGAVLLAAGVTGGAVTHFQLMPEITTQMSWRVQSEDKTTDNYIYHDMSNANRAMELCGMYQYLWRSFVVSTLQSDARQYSKMYEELDAWFAEKQASPHKSNAYSGKLAGKNCFFILLESIDTWLLTEDYMPNLYAVRQQSVDFANHYSSLYITASTFNTEFIANTGQIPPSAGLDTSAYEENTFPMALAKLFTEAGYTAKTFHSADPVIYNRGSIHKNLGYGPYYYHYNMGMDDYMLDTQLMRGFGYMTADQPFFDFILTFSGHGPYTEEMANISDPHLAAAKTAVARASLPIEARRSEEYLLAVAHAMETDAFIGELMQALEDSGLAEDTALVFFTDHYCKYMTDTDLVMKLKGVSDMDAICHTPFFIWSKDLPARSIPKVTSTMDIAPTIVNLFGLDADYAWYPGSDIFSADGGTAIFRGGSWYDGREWGGPTPETLQFLSLAGDVLRCDYFGRSVNPQ